MSETPKTYHGDSVRSLFLVAAFIMTALLPLFAVRIEESVVFSVSCIIILCVAAGLTSPKQKLSGYLNAIIALGGVIVFETRAVNLFTIYRQSDFFFVTNQILALIFVASLYFAIKTLRRISDGHQG